jgi:hypothetical protein
MLRQAAFRAVTSPDQDRRAGSGIRRRGRACGAALTVALGLFAVLAALAAPGAVAGDLHRPRPAAAGAPTGGLAGLLTRARAALADETRVHLHGQLSEIDDGVGVYVAVDVNAGAGAGTLSETIASKGRRVSLGALITPARGYCTGDPDALTAGCAMSAAQAFAARGHWVSFGPSTVPYRTVLTSVVFSNQTGGLLPAPSGLGFHLTRTRSYAGEAVEELSGPAGRDTGFPAGTVETLDLAASGAPLPVAVRFQRAGRVSVTEWFSSWGKPFSVDPPAHSVPLRTLG